MKSFAQVMELTRTVSSAIAFSDIECAALFDLCSSMPTSAIVVEIGCQLGRTSSIIAQVGADRRYSSTHIDPYTNQMEYLSGWIAMMHRIGTPFTLMLMRTDQAFARWHTIQQIDLLLIDGDHTAHGVEHDFLFADHYVRVGGILAAHDYGQPNLPDVKAVLDRLLLPLQWQKLMVHDTLGVWRRIG